MAAASGSTVITTIANGRRIEVVQAMPGAAKGARARAFAVGAVLLGIAGGIGPPRLGVIVLFSCIGEGSPRWGEVRTCWVTN